MPYKHNDKKRHHFKKHTYALNNYREYNQALRQRGRFDIWISNDIIKHWQHDIRIYDGTGSSVKYPDSTIEACHYIRLVYKLPLRQAQGLIDSLLMKFGMTNLIGCFALGIVGWQSVRQYGKRNVSETAMQRYKKIIGNTLHSRKIENQSKEMLLGCSILNRFTLLGMPNSYRVA